MLKDIRSGEQRGGARPLHVQDPLQRLPEGLRWAVLVFVSHGHSVGGQTEQPQPAVADALDPGPHQNLEALPLRGDLGSRGHVRIHVASGLQVLELEDQHPGRLRLPHLAAQGLARAIVQGPPAAGPEDTIEAALGREGHRILDLAAELRLATRGQLLEALQQRGLDLGDGHARAEALGVHARVQQVLRRRRERDADVRPRAVPLLRPTFQQHDLGRIRPDHAPAGSILIGVLLGQQQRQPETDWPCPDDGDASSGRRHRFRHIDLRDPFLCLFPELLQLRHRRGRRRPGELCRLLGLGRRLLERALVGDAPPRPPQERLHIRAGPSLGLLPCGTGSADGSESLGHGLSCIGLQSLRGPREEGFQVLALAAALAGLLRLLLPGLLRGLSLFLLPLPQPLLSLLDGIFRLFRLRGYHHFLSPTALSSCLAATTAPNIRNMSAQELL
mmetsp:Transcript_79311/g.222638  ORF Transcript_79311/g.222638 Transcript_79311/m.222638 type:complete len:445 (-) Transcript_79311:358-1692(-)